MPVVDLSRIGLEGIESAAHVAESRQRTDTSRFEMESAEADRAKMNALNQEASDAISRIGMGERTVEGNPATQMSSLAEPLETMGKIYLKGGAPEQGLEFITKASEIRKREDELKTSELTRRETALDNMIKASDLVSSTVGVARTKEDWDAAWETVERSRLVPAELSDLFKSMEFSPEAVDIVNEQSMSAKERAEVDRLANTADRQQRDSESLRLHRLATARIAQGRLDNALRLSKIAERNGTAATAPNKQEIASTAATIKSLIFKGVEPTDPSIKKALEAGSMTIAATAKTMLRADRTLDWETAVNRAVLESDAIGDWQPFVDVGKFMGIETSRTPIGAKYKPKGKTPEEALPFPTEKSKLVKGRFYATPKGTARWNGEAFSTD